MNLNQRVKKIQASKLNLSEKTSKQLQETIEKGNRMIYSHILKGRYLK